MRSFFSWTLNPLIKDPKVDRSSMYIVSKGKYKLVRTPMAIIIHKGKSYPVVVVVVVVDLA